MSKHDARGLLLAGVFFVGVIVLLTLTAGKTGAATRPVNKPTTPSFTDWA